MESVLKDFILYPKAGMEKPVTAQAHQYCLEVPWQYVLEGSGVIMELIKTDPERKTDMKKIPFISIACTLLAAVFLMPAHGHGQAGGKAGYTKHFSGSAFRITEKGKFSIEVLPDEREYPIGKGVVGIVIHDYRDEDIEGAELKLTVWNDKGQDLTTRPLVKEKGGGLYTVANLDLRRDGSWELRIRVSKGALEDGTTFVFPADLKEGKPAGKYDQESAGLPPKKSR